MAFSYKFNEPILITGATCYKQKCIKILSDMILFNNPNPLNTIYLSNMSEMSDLVGSIECHNEASYM